MANFIVPIQPDPTTIASSESSSELKRLTKSYICVETIDLEAFIKETTGQEYDIRSQEELFKDHKIYHVSRFDGLTGAIVTTQWEAFKAGTYNRIFLLEVILDGLCTEGKIPAGEYLIEAPW